MGDFMYTIEGSASYEQIIKRSRFICYLFPVTTSEEAIAFLKETRKKHYDATHNCYAYIIDDTQITARNSDDGEPAGTAGVVIYDILKKHEMVNVLAVVTRYFGGTKLGAGGLIRAYGGTTARALESAQKVKIEQCTQLVLEVDYSYYSLIEKKLEDFLQIDKQFTNKVIIKLRIPVKERVKIIANLTELTGGNIIVY